MKHLTSLREEEGRDEGQIQKLQINVSEPSVSSESEEYDPNSPSHLFSDDDNEEEFVGFPNRDFEWQEPEAKISPPPPCVQPTGPKTELPEEASALDFFQLFFDAELLVHLVRETNRFAEQSQTKAGKRNPLWKEALTVSELKA